LLVSVSVTHSVLIKCNFHERLKRATVPSPTFECIDHSNEITTVLEVFRAHHQTMVATLACNLSSFKRWLPRLCYIPLRAKAATTERQAKS
jgi:hypothetical protein